MLPCDLYTLCPDKKCVKVMTDCCVDKKKSTICQTYILENILSYVHPVKPQKKPYRPPVGKALPGNKGCTKDKTVYICNYDDPKLGCVFSKIVNSLTAKCDHGRGKKGKITAIPCVCDNKTKTLIGKKDSIVHHAH